MIELQNISFAYDGPPVLDNFNLLVENSKNTVLIGPSGCGKSTILRLVNRLVVPQKGSIKVDSIITDKDNIRSLRLKMGYVIQEGGLFPNMTAGENIALIARRLKWSQDKIAARVNELCRLTQIDAGLLERYPVRLSGGQRQRISIMRALMLDPDILLLDEPFGALDPLIRNELQENMLDICSTLKKTVLMVTHDLNEAAFLADKIVLLAEGKIIQSGSINDLVRKPVNAFVKKFVTAQSSHLPGDKQ